MEFLFKEFWKKRNTNALVIGVSFAILFAAIRGIGMLGPQSARPLIPLGFILMMALPFVFLTRIGRRQIGLVRSNSPSIYFVAILYGAIGATICYVTGRLLFQTGPDNWFITIRNFYLAQVPGATNMPLMQFFLIITIPALIFSPIGEEIFFRGFLQEALQTRLTLKVSMVIESAMFGLVHLFHHGLVNANGVMKFYPLSGMLWVVLMFSTAYGFAVIRKRSGSIYPAIVSHAVFNLTMNIFIFNFLLTE